MGRIEKEPAEHHKATRSPFVEDFIKRATEVPLHELPALLDGFPQHWPMPRGDLYHWIPLLNRLDHVYELFNKEYGLDDGPQTQPFQRKLLERGDAEADMPYPSSGAQPQELDASGYSAEGDRELVEALLHFTRILLEHCGNRSIYASSAHISNLLNTTSLSLLRFCLKLGLRLAQRYQVARYKSHGIPHAQPGLLAKRYNFNLDNLHKIAMPFPKPLNPTAPFSQTPGKGKDKATQATSLNTSDLVAIAKTPLSISARQDMSAVALSYYDQAATASSTEVAAEDSTQASPATPTPARRTSNLGPSRDRPSAGERSISADDLSATPVKSRELDSTPSTAPKSFHIPAAKVSETPAWSLLADALPNLPTEMRYELLNRVRIAKSFATSETTNQELLEIRLLAIANLAFALNESKFQEKIGIPDTEEDGQYHLAQQLCDLLQPAAAGQVALSVQMETTVVMALEALTKIRHKVTEVADALAITVNHGALYYELRKVIAALNLDENPDKKIEAEESEWRDATFDLVNSLLGANTQARYAEKMVTAGIMAILVEVLAMRTARAERCYERVLQFFDSFIHGIPTAFQTLANVNGLNIIADLTAHEVDAAWEKQENQKGIPEEYKSSVNDYNIPFYHQCTLRQLFKNTVHMFEHNAGTYDRLLRNLIDTPQILGALRKVIENASVFGSNVWSGALNIITSFIHNEPTCYQVIGEAGLAKAFFEAIQDQKIPEELPALESFEPLSEVQHYQTKSTGELWEDFYPGTSGILPVSEVMTDIPNAFGAFCLNESGMQLFQASGALVKYFDVFLSPLHVQAIENDDHAAMIGQQFDELSRHHPRLKPHILAAVFNMLRRLKELCLIMAVQQRTGAKLWELSGDEPTIAGGLDAMRGSATADYNGALESLVVSHSTQNPGQIEVDQEYAPAVPFVAACFKFLEGFFHNNSMTAMFCEGSGVELVLDLALSPSMPHDMFAFPLTNNLVRLTKQMADARPHLVLPSIVKRAQTSLLGLKDLMESESKSSSFGKYINPTETAIDSPVVDGMGATAVVKSLLHAQLLAHLLGRTLAPPTFSIRHGIQTNQTFAAVNLTDVYIQLIQDYSKLHATCLWESLLLQQILSDKCKGLTDPRPFASRRIDKTGLVKVAPDKSQVDAEVVHNHAPKSKLAYKNIKALRYLLGQVPAGMESFFHNLAQGIVGKRIEPTAKQHSIHIAECLAKALLWELDFRRNDVSDEAMETRYVALMLSMISRMPLRNIQASEHQHPSQYGTQPKEVVTLLLTKFYLADGFSKFNGYLQRFAQAIASQDAEKVSPQFKEAVTAILTLYNFVVRSNCINEAPQSSALVTRDRTQADFFQPGQFQVEIREAVLPAISDIWHSKDIDKYTDANIKSIVDILKNILKAEGEEKALKRSEKATRRVLAAGPEFRLRNLAGFSNLKLKGFGNALAREALYRCNNSETAAEAYCKLRVKDKHIPRFPPPQGEPAEGEKDETTVAPDNADADAHMSSGPADEEDEEDAHPNAATLSFDADGNPVVVHPGNPNPPDNDMMSDDDNSGTLGAMPDEIRADLMAMADPRTRNVLASLRPATSGMQAEVEDTHQPYKTVDDLNDSREALRGDLVDRCLDVLSAQPTITFELAELIQAAVAKAGVGANPRAEIGSTLVQSLMSLKMSEEPTSKEQGTKIQAYSHLVALILQDQDFFDSTLDDLKEYFGDLVEWVQLEPDQKAEDTPWMRTVLLIIERILAEDEKPVVVEWQPPSPEEPLKPLPEPKIPESAVSPELRTRLFDALIGILHKVGKNSSLALSICRVLVILTRRRDLATRLSEKYTLGRLFLMIRQLAGSVDEKLQSSFMLILRHMVEDDDVVRQIMRAEIRSVFENHRSSRAMDFMLYVRNLHHLALRSPPIFIEVTQELLEVANFDGDPKRGQALTLKKTEKTTEPPAEKKPDTEAKTEAGPATDSSLELQKPAEAKPLPVVETTDGVVQFLLRELSNFKDVEDKPIQAPKDDQPEKAAMDDFSPDVEMPDAAAPLPGSATPTAAAETKAGAKPPFKPEEHVIYIYRCFVLQCLAELLACYNRTKVEFINFSRKSDANPATPSKPRSGTLNYLLNTLLPPGTLEHRDDVAHRKKIATSNWATHVLVSLCTKTQENHLGHGQATDSADFSEKEPELTFVRKFVLEHALRSFKDATSSTEPLDQRYSRLLVLGELFNKMLSGKSEIQRSGAVPIGHFSSHQHMGRLMYEKNFIGTLTSAIAELDLNFPNAKRAVKYILGPLKQLTDLGVLLSQTTDMSSSSGPETSVDEDDISSATSVSEDDEEREQTPDLFRGSSLGMFETGQEDDESDDDDDDEDGEDQLYDDEMDYEEDYEEEPAPNHGDVVSDDDDDPHGMGEIEGLPGDVDMEVDVMMGEDDEEDSDDTSDDDDDEDDDEDDDPDGEIEFAEHMEEITGDDENASLDEHDHEGDWEDEDVDEFDDHGAVHDGGSPHGGPLEHIAHVLGADDPSEAGDMMGNDGIVRIDMDAGEDEFFEDEMAPEGDEDDDGEEYGADIVYEPEMDDDDDDEQDGGWAAWETQPPPAAVLRGHHHHHHHHPRTFEQMLGGMMGDPLRPGHFRTHRANGTNGETDGMNPLLLNPAHDAARRRELEALGGPRLAGRRGYLGGRGNEAFMQHLVASVPHPTGQGVLNVHLGEAGLAQFPSMFTVEGGRHAIGAPWFDLDPSRPWRDQLAAGLANGRPSERAGNDEASAVEFRPSQTSLRWQEEARMLYPAKYHEKATRVINMLFRVLVPQAMEARRLREKAEAERKVAQEKAAEEARKIAEAEKAEREAQEKKEREEREALERAESEARAAELAAQAGTESAEASEMEGVLPDPESAPAEAQAPEEPPAERIMINIRGRELDITTLGIDREYIEALPEEMREEVIMTQLTSQRSQAAASGETPSEISREFLDALPQEIQQELLRQEQNERRRVQRETQRRAAAQDGNAGPAAQPEEMNNADFMAMLDPALRQAVLMDTDEATLATLPDDLQAEARALFGDRRAPRPDHAARLARGMEAATARILDGQGGAPRDNAENREASRQRRPIVQMLDKAGIATLLRLMFVSLNTKPKTNLHGILSDVCKNTQNRSEVISILLSILQDGTADVNAVERSFAQLSLRAKQPSGPKTPQTLKRSLTGQQSVTSSTELSPLNIVQQCLGTLNALANDNPRVPSFFLNEHETIVSQKAKTAKKGKGRESKAAKFPLNALLTLLDRKLITENTAVMETLASLLSHVTHPLTILLRRAKEAQDAEKADAEKATDAEARPQTGTSDVPMEDTTIAETAEDDSAATASATATASAEDNTAAVPDAKKKKNRDLTPPEVPDENIRLVVNILAARDCPSKTFSDTLDIIKNLSAIPGAKEVFGRELIRQAQDLGQALLEDLEELSNQIKSAETGTELQGMASASLSSAGSKQSKLLRVLMALDHLFDPKRMPTNPSASPSGEQKLKEDILATLYDSTKFDKLWNRLSVCLTAIRERGNMVNVATILLPLIESLMVVCRNSTLKQPQAAPAETAVVSSPPPESRIGGLFFTFTDEHRKILNELIRNNPKLMNGNLAVLAKNSKVLEFDNKRSYFSRKLHDRRAEVRVAHPTLQLNLRRSEVFLDSFKSLYYKSANEIKYGKLNIRFHNEEGVDAGGVSREWFAAMARQMFDPNYALFTPVASDRTTFHPNTMSGINGEHLMFFKFVGRIIGKALYENRVLDCHFSRAVYRRILGKSVSLKDMETLDLDYYKSLVWILENDITDVTFETFSVEEDKFGVTETIDLIPNGRNIPVTEDNKHEYVRHVVDYRLVTSVKDQLDNFLTGFHEIIPAELVAIFNEQELELLISGLPDVDVDDWKNNTEYTNYQPTSPQIMWFWRAVKSFDKEEKAKLLQFITGTSKVPLNGFKELEGMNGFTKFAIHRDYGNKDRLPSSHTCFNQLDLPEYETYEALRHQLYTAITAGSEYFGFA